MVDSVRRLLATLALLVAAVGLLTIAPRVLGFRTATVTNDTAGTFFPAASASPASRYVSCRQTGNASWTLKKNTTFNGGLFECDNNWNSSVTVTISLQNDPNTAFSAFSGGSGVTIAPGGTGCISSTTSFTSRNANVAQTTVTYSASVTTAGGDLAATLYFTGLVQVQNPGTTPTTCTP